MAEKEINTFSFELDSANELTEEIYIFPNTNAKKNDLIFIFVVLIASILIAFISYQLGSRLNVDKEQMLQIYSELKETDVSYIEEIATNDTLLAENEKLTQEHLKNESEAKQLKEYSINKSTLDKKLESSKTEYDGLVKSIEERKKQISENSEEIYTLTLNPGVYLVGTNIPAATFSVTGNGSILASSKEKETKINEKLSKDTPIDVVLLDGYTVKITTITKFTLKE